MAYDNTASDAHMNCKFSFLDNQPDSLPGSMRFLLFIYWKWSIKISISLVQQNY